MLINGQPARSCITPVSVAEGKKITTIEGLEQDSRLHPLQEAFLETEAMQCGFCTAGMTLSGVALLNGKQNPSDAEIIGFMQGNICRCGTYPRIVAAIRKAAEALRNSGTQSGNDPSPDCRHGAVGRQRHRHSPAVLASGPERSPARSDLGI